MEHWKAPLILFIYSRIADIAGDKMVLEKDVLKKLVMAGYVAGTKGLNPQDIMELVESSVF